jgi:hypothetical protein
MDARSSASAAHSILRALDNARPSEEADADDALESASAVGEDHDAANGWRSSTAAATTTTAPVVGGGGGGPADWEPALPTPKQQHHHHPVTAVAPSSGDGGAGDDYDVGEAPIQTVSVRLVEPAPVDPPNEDKDDYVSVDADHPKHVVDAVQHITTARTLSVFGTSHPATLFEPGYKPPLGVHCAHYVSFSFVLTKRKPVWMVNDASLNGKKDALQKALKKAYPYQPSVDTRKLPDGRHPVYLARPSFDTEFDTTNAIVMAAFVERFRVVRGGAVGVRVGMYTDDRAPNAAPADARSPAPQTILENISKYASCVHDASGEGYSLVAHESDGAQRTPHPVRLGAPFCNEWTNSSAVGGILDETRCWTGFEVFDTPGEEFWFGDKVAFAPNPRDPPPPHVGKFHVALTSLPHHPVRVFEGSRAVAQLVSYAPTSEALRHTYMRWKIYERLVQLSGEHEPIAAALAQVNKKYPIWLVYPGTESLRLWSDASRIPRAGEDESVGVRTLTREEELLISRFRISVNRNHVTYSVLRAHIPPDRVHAKPKSSAIVVYFTDYVDVVNANLASHARNVELRQLRDASRITACAYSLSQEEEEDFEMELTVGFVIAPLELSPITSFSSKEKDVEAASEASIVVGAVARDLEPGYMYANARIVTTAKGDPVAVVPLDSVSSYIKTAAWRRALS